MRNSRVAKRYATSLLELAIERGVLDAVKDDMELIRKTTAESHELDLMLHSPIVKADKKKVVFAAIFEKSVNALTLHFMNVITDKGREKILISICEAFAQEYRTHQGIVRVEITSARPMTEDERTAVNAKFQASGMDKLELTETVDPSIIGGLKIKVGDRLMDGSILKKLHQLQKQVTKN